MIENQLMNKLRPSFYIYYGEREHTYCVCSMLPRECSFMPLPNYKEIMLSLLQCWAFQKPNKWNVRSIILGSLLKKKILSVAKRGFLRPKKMTNLPIFLLRKYWIQEAILSKSSFTFGHCLNYGGVRVSTYAQICWPLFVFGWDMFCVLAKIKPSQMEV